MSKLIALRSGFNDEYSHRWVKNYSSQLKQQALLFDQIGILGLSSMNEFLDMWQSQIINLDSLGTLVSELRWLEENNIVFEANIQEELKPKAHVKITDIEKLFETQEVIAKKFDKNEYGDDLTKLIIEHDAIILRLMSQVMEATKEINVVTTLPYTEYTRELPNSSKSDIAQVVIKKLPLPSNETPWEQLIDYRNDAKTQKSLLDLRRWIRKISTENLAPHEIEEEIEWLINEFENHMKLHKMKENTEAVEVITKAPLEFLELKFSKIIEPLFAIKKRKINLLEAEMNAPGREMSYIIKTRDAFQSDE